uniref:thyroid transcription factor 1-associated protein 26 isoform X1 n=2 Tax=Myxine glutinosa TaxID=7769 RepID=UPI00358E79BE
MAASSSSGEQRNQTRKKREISKLKYSRFSEEMQLEKQRTMMVKSKYMRMLKKMDHSAAAQVDDAQHYPEHLKHLYEEEQQDFDSRVAARSARRRAHLPPVQEQRVKLTAYQKANEEYKRISNERQKKHEDREQRKKDKEEAIKKYKKKKWQKYRVLMQKTKKGQPRLNLQIDHLLKEIQDRMEASK